MGFGGAEAAAVTYYKLNEFERQKVIKAYFDASDGLGYTLIYNLIDGHHRVEKARRTGVESIPAISSIGI